MSQRFGFTFLVEGSVPVFIRSMGEYNESGRSIVFIVITIFITYRV